MKPTQRQIGLFSYNLELGFGDREVARKMAATLAPILPGEITKALKVCFDQVEIGPLEDKNHLRDLLYAII